MDNRKPLVIAIAAVSGGGKTTIVNHLTKILHNSKALFFDEYEFDCPDDICDWVERGVQWLLKYGYKLQNNFTRMVYKGKYQELRGVDLSRWAM